MSVLQRFEKRLEGLVEGAFAKVFKGVVHPVEILNAMQREAEAHKAILAGGRTLVPNRYVIDLSPYDHSRLAPYAAALAQELAQSQAEFIGEQGVDGLRRRDRRDRARRGPGHRHVPGHRRGLHRRRRRPGVRARLRRRPAGLPARTTRAVATAAPPGHGGPARNVRLVSGDGRTYPLSIGSTVIGRGDQANLRLPDVGISRRHARLDFDGGQVVLTDLGLDQRHHGQRPAGLRRRAQPGRHDPARHDDADLPRGRLTRLAGTRHHRRPVRVPRPAVDLRVHGGRRDPSGPVRGRPVRPAGRRAPRGGRLDGAAVEPAKVKRGRAAHQLVVTAGAAGRHPDHSRRGADHHRSGRGLHPGHHRRLRLGAARPAGAPDGQWFVEDLGSTNGTYLDRAKVTGPTPVPLGVPIRIGRTSLELRP